MKMMKCTCCQLSILILTIFLPIYNVPKTGTNQFISAVLPCFDISGSKQ